MATQTPTDASADAQLDSALDAQLDSALDAQVEDPTDAQLEDPAENCDSACSSCAASCSSRTAPTDAPADRMAPTNSQTTIKHVIAVVSGKGGVGKSLVTSLLATTLHKQGLSVGILDADITGPSIPKAFGVEEKLRANAQGILPSVTSSGIQVVSTNLVLPDDTTPVIWRGTIISGMVKQFYSEVIWGELDYLLIDMPPGTGDVPLTVYQSLPIDGVVIVTAPQDLVSMIVGKAINMAGTMEVDVLGIVENMAYFECPSCGTHHDIFGASKIEAVAQEYAIDLTAQIPIDSSFAQAMDAGAVEILEVPALLEFASEVIKKAEGA